MDIQFAFGMILSALIGLSLGLIGGGGSIITVPVLVYALNVEPYDAVGMSLAVVGVTSLIGSFLHWRHGTLQMKTALIFGSAGIFGALAGSPLTKMLSPSALMLAFAGLMFVVAILMLRKKTGNEVDVVSTNVPSIWKALAVGFGVGVLTGFLGVGGGFLIVPALVMFGGLSIKDAIGTSLFVIFLNCVAGLAGHASQNHFNWNLTAIVTLLAGAGAIAGTMLSHRVAAQKLQKGFAMFVLMVAVLLIGKNYGVFFEG
ncbi:MAG: sulfite exporter TauE/SafE family protein [Acidobacteriota bacterium]